MEKIMNNIGIFILNYNGLYWLKQNVKKLIEESSHSDIIVIDNNSTDSSVTYLKTHFPQIKIKINDENYGFCKGYNNILLKENKYKYFVLINNDVEVTANWIEPMLEVIKNKNIGIVQPKILNYQHRNQFDYAGAAGGFLDILGLPFCRGRIISNIEFDNNQYSNNIPISWAAGCCFMIKSDLYHALNGFDEDLFMHQEEIDLCWRAHDLNNKVYYCHNSTVYHVGGGSLSYNNPIKSFYNHRNNLLLILKNMPYKHLIIALPIRIMIDYLIIILLSIQSISNIFIMDWSRKKIKRAKAVIQAHWSFLFWTPRFIAKRKPIHKSKILYNKVIMIEYYLKQRRKFSELK
jgi:GT2 family glycosyltransferase